MQTFIVDSFTDVPFRGNPAGVCLVDSELDDGLMLKIAQELGLSETAFVRPLTGGGEFAIRYFSPKMEIPLCGHATLAAAKVIFDSFTDDEIVFVTGQQLVLNVRRCPAGIQMTFPVYATRPTEARPQLLAALGIHACLHAAYNAETRILMLEIADTAALAALAPDFEALRLAHDSINGVLVTAASRDGEFDFHSRYFWPWSGTNEDPVTGGTHTFLAPYWSGKLGKTKMKSFQSSSRSGQMDLELLPDKLLITGRAVTVFAGHLAVRSAEKR